MPLKYDDLRIVNCDALRNCLSLNDLHHWDKTGQKVGQLKLL